MKFYPLALIALLTAATPALAGGGHSYSYDSCLADCSAPAHSWKNGCCEREPSCCDDIWDGYCPDPCCGTWLPLPIIHLDSLRTNAAPYRAPCLHLPKLRLPHCTSSPCCVPPPPPTCHTGCCHKSPWSWLHGLVHRCPQACGDSCSTDLGCGAGAMVENYHVPQSDPHSAAPNVIHNDKVPTDAAPLPPAPAMEPMPMNNKGKKNNKKKSGKKSDSKTASLWLFDTLST